MLLVLFTNQNLSKVAKFLVKVYIFMFFSFLTYDLKFKFPQWNFVTKLYFTSFSHPSTFSWTCSSWARTTANTLQPPHPVLVGAPAWGWSVLQPALVGLYVEGPRLTFRVVEAFLGAVQRSVGLEGSSTRCVIASGNVFPLVHTARCPRGRSWASHVCQHFHALAAFFISRSCVATLARNLSSWEVDLCGKLPPVDIFGEVNANAQTVVFWTATIIDALAGWKCCWIDPSAIGVLHLWK